MNSFSYLQGSATKYNKKERIYIWIFLLRALSVDVRLHFIIAKALSECGKGSATRGKSMVKYGEMMFTTKGV